MLKTYIGLMLNGNLDKHEDRKIALDALFRHSQTGEVSEAASTAPGESIIKIIDQQTRNASKK